MHPVVHGEPYVFVSLPAGTIDVALATFREREGFSAVVRQVDADAECWPYDSLWACITLEVYSSLSAVGFLSALLPNLAAAGMSVNPVSAFHHDHLFVPWDRREEAVRILQVIETNPSVGSSASNRCGCQVQ